MPTIAAAIIDRTIHNACKVKGKSAIQVAQVYLGKRKNFTGQHFWAKGYFVSTVGVNEQMIRAYIKAQEKEDRRLDQMNLFEE